MKSLLAKKGVVALAVLFFGMSLTSPLFLAKSATADHGTFDRNIQFVVTLSDPSITDATVRVTRLSPATQYNLTYRNGAYVTTESIGRSCDQGTGGQNQYDILVFRGSQKLGEKLAVNVCRAENHINETVSVNSGPGSGLTGEIRVTLTYADASGQIRPFLPADGNSGTSFTLTGPTPRDQTHAQPNGNGQLLLTELLPGTYRLVATYRDGATNGEYSVVIDPIEVSAGKEASGGNVIAPEGPPPEEAQESEPPSCEEAGLDLSWMLCPLLSVLDHGIGYLDGLINNVLQVPNDYLENTNLRESWKIIRNFAYLILLPISLVMVISTALGFEFFSAYTVKKALPRLVVAVIFIALSFDITVFLVRLTNDVGAGLAGLIQSPFLGEASNGTITLASIFSPNTAEGVGGFLVAVAASPALLLSSIGIILSYGLVFFVALLMGFVLLSLRQLLIVALMLLAPLAILSWIFPGNDKLWKLWWSSFSKLLILYPVIVVLITMGKVFSTIVADTEGSLIGTFIKATAYIGPYFFIPAAFKTAGGVFATIAGIADSKEKGLFDRQRNYRKKKFAENRKKQGENNRFNAERFGGDKTLRGRLLNRVNSLGSYYASNPADSAHILLKTDKGKAILSDIETKKLQQTSAKSDALGKSGITIDKGLAALAGAGTYLDSSGVEHKIDRIYNQETLEKAISEMSQAYRLNGDGELVEDHQSRMAAQQLNAASSFLTTAYDDPNFGRGNMEGAALMAWAKQGFASPDEVMEISNRIGEETNNPTLGAKIGQQAAYLAYANGGRMDFKPTYGLVPTADGEGLVPAGLERQKELVVGIKGYEWQQQKRSAVQNLRPAMVEVVHDGGENGRTMAQTIATNANSATDPASRAEWRDMASEVFNVEIMNRMFQSQLPGYKGPQVSREEALDAILYEKTYGKHTSNMPESVQQSTTGNTGPDPTAAPPPPPDPDPTT